MADVSEIRAGTETRQIKDAVAREATETNAGLIADIKKLIPAVATSANKLITASELSDKIKMSRWVPYNGYNPLANENGFFAYSVNPNLMISQGVPSGLSNYATVFGIRAAVEYPLLIYIDVFGGLAIWNSNAGYWRVYA